jgi:flavin reductase (DIM6/NTAB) family NADH-FMN oxidoreductase RutF
MKLKHFSTPDWADQSGRYWSTFFNSISGPRSVFMIGTEDRSGIANIGLFNSIVHIGAKPPLIGFILRPTDVERHTYSNLLEHETYTINHCPAHLVDQAHQSSAKYARDVDEFDVLGFHKQYIDGFSAPFIAESTIKLGLHFKEEYLITANHTRLIVGEVQHVLIDEQLVHQDGYIHTDRAQTLLVSGLDAYHSHRLLKRMSYARP